MYTLTALSMGVHTLDFKRATDELCSAVTHEELAGALGVKLPSVRQARLGDDAKAKRSPPAGWERVVSKLAKARAERLLKLAAKLTAG